MHSQKDIEYEFYTIFHGLTYFTSALHLFTRYEQLGFARNFTRYPASTMVAAAQTLPTAHESNLHPKQGSIPHLLVSSEIYWQYENPRVQTCRQDTSDDPVLGLSETDFDSDISFGKLKAMQLQTGLLSKKMLQVYHYIVYSLVFYFWRRIFVFNPKIEQQTIYKVSTSI